MNRAWPALVILLSGCCPARDAGRDAVIAAWLECQDCGDEPLDRVVAEGRCAVPGLVQALQQGPPRAREDSVRAYLTRLRGTLPGAPAHLTAPAVATVIGNYRVQYRIRAADGLAAIKGARAIAALDAALADSGVTGGLRDAIVAARLRAATP